MTDETPIEKLRRLAEAMPDKVSYQRWLNQPIDEWHAYELARAEFWKAAFELLEGSLKTHDEYDFDYVSMSYSDAERLDAIIASVRAKEQA